MCVMYSSASVDVAWIVLSMSEIVSMQLSRSVFVRSDIAVAIVQRIAVIVLRLVSGMSLVVIVCRCFFMLLLCRHVSIMYNITYIIMINFILIRLLGLYFSLFVRLDCFSRSCCVEVCGISLSEVFVSFVVKSLVLFKFVLYK